MGLGPLLGRMPSALEQIVGETGWQLSHGERSLVYIARGLLANAHLIILDESFGRLTRERSITLSGTCSPVTQRCSSSPNEHSPPLAAPLELVQRLPLSLGFYSSEVKLRSCVV